MRDGITRLSRPALCEEKHAVNRTEALRHHTGGIKPVTKDDWLDLLYIQKSCWWKLNYAPPYSPPF